MTILEGYVASLRVGLRNVVFSAFQGASFHRLQRNRLWKAADLPSFTVLGDLPVRNLPMLVAALIGSTILAVPVAAQRPTNRAAMVQGGGAMAEAATLQGFSTSLRNGGIDPINVFPIAPTSADASRSDNYSPLSVAHVNMGTLAAVAGGKVKRIHSLGELGRLVRAGLVTNASINPPGAFNSYVAGLRPTQAIINCPVIAQSNLPPR